MGNQNAAMSFLAVALLWTLAGCASVGVRNPSEAAVSPKLPEQILVADFETATGPFRVNRSGDELVAFQQKSASVLANYLVSDISKSVMRSALNNNPKRVRMDAWLITGEFVRVNQGSRALRGLVGLGAGGTKLETVVRVYDLSHLSKEPVLQFETSGGSNAEPGAILGGMFGALPNAVRNAGARGVTDDTARTAREITAMVADYYVKNGGQLSGKAQKPKMLARNR
jgi:Domain of unknown function (DUF4410)